MRKIQKTHSVIVVATLAAVCVSVYLFRDPLGWALWRTTHAAPIAAALNQSDPMLLLDIGNYYFGGGAYDTRKAESYFRRALALDATLEGPHYQLARIYFIHSDFSAATEEINKEIKLHPEFMRAHYVRGLIYGYNNRLAEAEIEFKTFLQWKPDSWAGHNDLAWIYFQEGKYIEARDTARAGLTRAPHNPWLLNSLGVALLNTGETEGAREAFTKALALLATMTEKEWGAAYPGNDPGIYTEGYTKMKASLEANLQLLATGDTGHSR